MFHYNVERHITFIQEEKQEDMDNLKCKNEDELGIQDRAPCTGRKQALVVGGKGEAGVPVLGKEPVVKVLQWAVKVTRSGTSTWSRASSDSCYEFYWASGLSTPY